MKKLTVYVAGPIGKQMYATCVRNFYDRVDKLRSIGYDTLCPLFSTRLEDKSGMIKSGGYDDMPEFTDDAVVHTDFWRVDTADIIFVDFTNAGRDVSIGSVAEISRAFARGKCIVTVMPKKSVHDHPFVRKMSSVIFDDVEDAYDFFARIIQ